MTVQQHAALSDELCGGAFWPDWCVLVGQQHDVRVTPSYSHRYQDAIATDGTRIRARRTGMTRRTLAPDHTRGLMPGNACTLTKLHLAVITGLNRRSSAFLC